MRMIYLFFALGLASNVFASIQVTWADLKTISKNVDGSYTTLAWDSWLFSDTFAARPAEDHYMLIEMTVSTPIDVDLRWMDENDQHGAERTFTFRINQVDTPVLTVLDLDVFGTFSSMKVLRLDPGNDAGVTFALHRLEFVSAGQLPSEFVTELVDFKGYTSKLHYQPGELIEYRATLLADSYPTRNSAKRLTANIVDSGGTVVASQVQQYALPGIVQMKEIYGVINPAVDLSPGQYRLETVSLDLLSGLELTSSHEFGVQSDTDPFIYETPFKFVKDFSILQDQGGLWHIFSITGDLFEGHDWQPDGNERTFSHGTSSDLRHWEYHPTVLSISENNYPDGNGKYEDRNIWAPHVIEHNGTYYMFYTSVNKYVSQSISVATSTDLFNWTEHGQNPVVTLENAGWALWQRSGWGDCRDPAVLEDSGTYYMYFTAQTTSGGGAVAVCESSDLINWTTPTIAVNGINAMESPQVWKEGSTYFMMTSSTGVGVWKSTSPDSGWSATSFPRPPIQAWENYVPTSGSYAEEVAPFGTNNSLMASLTWRLWGNSIYISKIITDGTGKPTGYESPFILGE